MNTSLFIRILLDIVIMGAVIHGWWFIALPCAVWCAWKYPYFVELIIAGLAYDSLFGLIPGAGVMGYIGTGTGIALFLTSGFFKNMLRHT